MTGPTYTQSPHDRCLARTRAVSSNTRHRDHPFSTIAACFFSLVVSGHSSAFTSGQAPSLPPGMSPNVQVRVVDAYSGFPVAQAPVQVIGYPFLRVTDTDGWARFNGLPISIGGEIRVWTTPPDHGPASKEWTITTQDNWILVKVPPLSTTLSTGLIDPTSGGLFPLQGALPTEPPTLIDMEIEVPPNAFTVPVRIHFLPYPQHACFLHGMPQSAYMLGLVHVSVTDANGRPHSQTLGAPVVIRSTPYAVQGVDFESVFDLSTLAFQTYDYVLHEWIDEATSPSYDPQSGKIEYATLHFSFKACGVDQKAGPDGTLPPPAPKVDYKWSKCELVATATVYCGLYTNGASCSMSASESTTFSAELSAQLEQTYGAQAGNAALGSISAQVGVKISGTVGGSLTATSGSSSTVSIDHGSVAGDSCFSGVDRLYRVSKVYGVKVGDLELGIITVPTRCALDQERTFVQACCPGGGGEGPQNVPVYPHTLERKPSDCVES